MKKITIISIVLMIIIFSITNVFASNTMTESDLENAIEKVKKLDENEDTFTINGEILLDKDNDIISMCNEKENIKYDISYNLEGNPTFTNRIIYTKDMTKDEFELNNSLFKLGMYPLMIACTHKGVDIEDTVSYILLNDFSLDLDNAIENIKDEDFKPVEIVNRYFKEEMKQENLLYNVNIKKISDSEEECIVECTYEIKINEDFSVLKDLDGAMDHMPNKPAEGANTYLNEIARDEETMQEVLNLIASTENTQNNESDKNIEINEIPQTGKTFGNLDFLWVMLFGSVAILVLYTIYNRRIDGNK